MTSRNHLALLSAFISMVIVAMMLNARHAGAQQQQQPAAAGQADEAEWSSSAIRIVTTPKRTLFHTTFTTTFAEMDKVVGTVEELFKTLKEQNIDWFAGDGSDGVGYVMFIYKGVQQDRSQPFELSIGITVPAGTKPAGKYQVRELAEFRCASTLYNGGLQTLGGAYQKLFTELFGAGHTPTDETREVYLYWEGHESKNNVVWIQAGLQ